MFIGAAVASLHDTPLVTALLVAQALAIAAVAWIIGDARRSREEVASLRDELAGFKVELSDLKAEMVHLDEHTELLASRTERLAKLLEIQAAIRPSGGTGEETGEILTFPARPRRIP